MADHHLPGTGTPVLGILLHLIIRWELSYFQHPWLCVDFGIPGIPDRQGESSVPLFSLDLLFFEGIIPSALLKRTEPAERLPPLSLRWRGTLPGMMTIP